MTRCGLGTATRSRVLSRRTSRRNSWATPGVSHGVHKWIAYDRVSGKVVGRGGLSRTPVERTGADLCVPSGGAVGGRRTCDSAARSWRTRIGWRSDGRYGAGSGGGATRLRSGAPGWRSHSSVLGSASGGVVHCAPQRTFARRHGAHGHAVRGCIHSRGLVEGAEGEQDDAPFAVCALLRETGTGPERLLWPHEEQPKVGTGHSVRRRIWRSARQPGRGAERRLPRERRLAVILNVVRLHNIFSGGSPAPLPGAVDFAPARPAFRSDGAADGEQARGGSGNGTGSSGRTGAQASAATMARLATRALQGGPPPWPRGIAAAVTGFRLAWSVF